MWSQTPYSFTVFKLEEIGKSLHSVVCLYWHVFLCLNHSSKIPQQFTYYVDVSWDWIGFTKRSVSLIDSIQYMNNY
jgi:hypothetical protein